MLKIIFAVVVTICLCLPVSLWLVASHSLAAREGIATIDELSDPVVVHFDGQGIPYIEAKSDQDLYMCQGYLAAQDRLFQMDIARREASGQLAEVFGLPLLPTDKLIRSFGLRTLAQEELASLSQSAHEGLDAYVKGVNAYMEKNQDKLPLEFALAGYKPQRWDAVDTLTILKYYAFRQDESWKLDDLRQRILNKVSTNVYGQLFANRQNTQRKASAYTTPLVVAQTLLTPQLGQLTKCWQSAGPTLGSNAIAISGKLTQTKIGLLACDKHTSFSLPDLYYSLAINSPSVHASGATIAGVPGIMIGRNDWIAWSSVSLKADVQDLFVEQFSPQSANLPYANQYRTETGWKTASEHDETIAVRFAKPYVLKVLTTRHGPVIMKNGTQAVVLAWTGFNAGDHNNIYENAPAQTAHTSLVGNSAFAGKSSLESIWLLDRAHNWPTFMEALSGYPGPTANFVYVDRGGNIGVQAAGIVPVRKVINSGQVLSAGWIDDGQWLGTIPFSALPNNYNPSNGFIVEANQSPNCGNLYLGNQFCPDYRYLRATAMLTTIGKGGRCIALTDLNDLAADTYAPLAPLIKQEVSKSLEKNNIIDRFQLTAARALNAWPGFLKGDSYQASIYESFTYTLLKRALVPKLGPELTNEYLNKWPGFRVVAESILTAQSANWLPAEERVYPSFITDTFGQSLKYLRNSFHSDNIATYSWQQAHTLTFNNIISRFIPWLSLSWNKNAGGIGGDETTLSTFDIDYHDNQTIVSSPFKSATGPTQRFLIDMSDSDKFYQSASLGQSGQIFSPYYDNQLKSWLKADASPIAFSTNQVDKQSEHRLIFVNHLASRGN